MAAKKPRKKDISDIVDKKMAKKPDEGIRDDPDWVGFDTYKDAAENMKDQMNGLGNSVQSFYEYLLRRQDILDEAFQAAERLSCEGLAAWTAANNQLDDIIARFEFLVIEGRGSDGA